MPSQAARRSVGYLHSTDERQREIADVLNQVAGPKRILSAARYRRQRYANCIEGQELAANERIARALQG